MSMCGGGNIPAKNLFTKIISVMTVKVLPLFRNYQGAFPVVCLVFLIKFRPVLTDYFYFRTNP